jgi:hypothetical protein
MVVGYLLNAWMDPIAGLRDWMNRAGSPGPVLFVVSFLALNTLNLPYPCSELRLEQSALQGRS